MSKNEYNNGEAYHSPLWYLAPIAAGIVGGLIMFFALRNDAPTMSKFGFLTGCLFEAIYILVFHVILFDQCSMFYGWI